MDTSTFKNIIAYILKLESRLVLWKYKPKVVAITGSVGKTSTKDAVYAVISSFAYVRKSEKSYNSEIGLPLTILGVPNGWSSPYVWLKNILKGAWLFIWPHKYPEWLVLEVGVGKPGDMDKTASWLASDAVIMTAIGDTPVHIEFFDSRAHLIEEKSRLIKTLKREGLLVLNADDPAMLAMKAKSNRRSITYGFQEGADIVGSGESILYNGNVPAGLVFRVDDGGASLPVTIEGVFGRNHAYATLAALALSSGLNFDMIRAIEALKNYEVPPGRMRLLRGINDTLLIDDTYNSSPFAALAALETLGAIKSLGRKIAVLGDMLELGRHTQEAHENVGRMAKNNADILVVVGPRAAGIRDGAMEKRMRKGDIYEFPNSREAGDFLRGFVTENDIVFIKGSQSMRMERAVESLLFDQANKARLLVRQEPEWQRKA